MRSVKVLALVASVALASRAGAGDESPCDAWWTPLQIGVWGERAQLCSKDRAVRGLRLSLPYSECEEACGLALGAVNHAGSVALAVEAGAVNVVDDGNALQAGLMNSANLQIIVLPYLGSGAADAAACQLGLLNLSSEWALQVGALNMCSGAGLQLGAVNVGGLAGVQAGLLYNDAHDARGLQVGLVNVAKTMSGVQIGVVNVIRESPVPLLPLVNAHF